MLNNTIKTLFLLILSTSVSWCQEAGYYGKKTFIEVGGIGQVPVFQNVFGQIKGYSYVNNQLQKGYNLVDYTLRGSFATIVNENLALGLEVSNRWYQFNAQKGDELNRQFIDSNGVFQSQLIPARLEMIPVQETTIMPRLVFSNMNGRVPSGLTQEVGVGYSMIRVGKDDLAVEVLDTTVVTSESLKKQLLDDRMESAKGLVFMYGIRMNYPISQSLLAYVGVRYQYNYLLGRKDYKSYELTEDWVSGREIWSRLNQRRQLGMLNFGAGLVLVF